MINEAYGLKVHGIRIDWSKISRHSYLRGIPAITDLEFLNFDSPVTFFVGENGSGKSTLLEAIAVAYGFNPEGGTKNYSFSTYDSHSELCDAITLIKNHRRAEWGYFLRAESFYNVATAEEEYSRSGGAPLFLHKRSHGESFLAAVQEHFRPNSFYLMDEPEAALSPQRQMTMLMEIVRCAEEGSQFIIATHSPILLSVPNAEILSFDGERIHRCEYEDTESYRITELFINDRKHILDMLLK